VFILKTVCKIEGIKEERKIFFVERVPKSFREAQKGKCEEKRSGCGMPGSITGVEECDAREAK